MKHLRILKLVILACIGLATVAVRAQPANDNFSSAEVISGGFGSASDDNTGATAEPGEPSHAGFPATFSIWYQWVAPSDGEVTVDTMSTGLGASGLPLDTVLAVYTGPDVAHLTQAAANDDIYPVIQRNVNANLALVFDGPFIYTQPLNGPSSLRFNAIAGTTYYFAVDTKFGDTGPIEINWAFHPSGVFRFATEDAQVGIDLNTFNFAQTPVIQTSETESFPPIMWTPTVFTYYRFNVPGCLITVTRSSGSTGRMLVDYSTADPVTTLDEDIPAISGVDYTPVQGTLVFDDFEMSKDILIPIFPDFSFPEPNRDFNVVLSNPRPAPDESPEVSPPRVDPTFGTMLVRILDVDIDPIYENNFDTNGVFVGPTNNVFNFAKARYRTPEDVNDYWSTVIISVARDGTNTAGETIEYSINNYFRGDKDDAQIEEDNNRFPLQPGSDYATPTPPNSTFIRGKSPDFTLAKGTLTWGQGDFLPKDISFTITNDTLLEFNEDLHIMLYRTLSNPTRRLPVGTVGDTCLTILFDDQDPPAGSVDENYNADFGSEMAPPVATTPSSKLPHPGADGTVYDLLVQNDDRSIIAGGFSSYDTIARNSIARINLNGSLDTSFDAHAGVAAQSGSFISSMAFTPSAQIIVGGNFTSFDNQQRTYVARLNSNGSLDLTFNPGVPGIDGTVWAVAAQSDGKVLIGGEFTTINGVSRPYVARLNVNGTLDTTFNPLTNAPNGTVNALLLTSSGQVVIGGVFTQVGSQSLNGLARLNADGSLDSAFAQNLGSGFDGPVYSLALQSDGTLLVGGDFVTFNLTARSRLLRLTTAGALDTSFDPGTGADDVVYSITPQADGTLYVGGRFTVFNGTHRLGFTRLYADGTVDTTFMDTAYNQFAGLHRLYYDKQTAGDPRPFVYAAHEQSDGNVMIGGGFNQVGGGQSNPNIRFDPDFPTNIYNTDVWLETKARDGLRNRANVARLLGGSTDGPGNIGLAYDTYTVNKSQSFLYANLIRTNGTLGFSSANFVVEPGLAQGGTDFIYNSIPPIYTSSWRQNLNSSVANATTRMHSDGLFNQNSAPEDINGNFWFNYTPGDAVISVLSNNGIEGDRDTLIKMANPADRDQFYLGAENIPLGVALGRSTATLTIHDDNRKTNFLGFASTVFVVNETATNAVITVVRTNGTAGSASVHYATVGGGTAVAGVNYQARSGNLNFGSGVTTQTFLVPILDDHISEPNGLTINLQLSSIQGAVYGLSTAQIQIIDNDGSPGLINFSSAAYATNQSAGAVVLTVTRTGADRGTVSVQCGTTNGTALNGVNYSGLTNTLTWNDLDFTPRFVTVPLLNNGLVGGNLTFQAMLMNPTVNTTNQPAVLGATKTTTITITNDNSFGNLRFSLPSYNVNENGGYATVTVIRTGGAAQTLTVHFATSDAGAVSSGVLPNFVATNGTLTFGPGEVSKSFNVAILDDGVVDPASGFFFYVTLSGLTPAGATFGSPTVAQVNILDAEFYNIPAGSPDTAFNPIPGFNGDVYSISLQTDGKIIAGGNFTSVNNATRNRVVRLNSNANLDTTFQNGLTGANGPVQAVVAQTDGRVLLAGSFTSVNGVNRNRIARLAGDGSLDTSFSQGSGADGTVYSMAETFVNGVRKVLVGGGFVTVNGLTRPGLTRLNNDASLDASFSSALNISGTVYAIAVYPTNGIQASKIMIGGDFTAVNGVGRKGIARLNPDGTLDLGFNPGTGASDPVRAIAIQLDGRVLIGGSFTNFNGTSLNHVARLNVDGSRDTGFNLGLGTDDTVDAIAVQADNRILLAGQFLKASGVSRSHITRLMPDGTLDSMINFGAGADAFIDALTLQADGMILIGGGFTQFDGLPRQHLARLYGGTLAGPGMFEFTSGNYQVDENATNAVITVRRRGGTTGNVTVHFFTSDGTAVAGVNYSNVVADLLFPTGETFQNVTVPVRDDLQITPDLVANLTLTNAPLGSQPVAYLTILNDDSAINFAEVASSVSENVSGGGAFIHILRSGSTRGIAAVDFSTTTNGTAAVGTNYQAVATTVTFQPGDNDLTVRIPILHNPVAEGNKTVGMQLTNTINALLFNPSFSTLTIVDVDQAPGQLLFSQTNYVVNEGDGTLTVTVLRTNGSSGTVSVQYSTVPGTALPGTKYTTTAGSLTFLNGDVSKTFTVPIIDGTTVEGNQVFSLVLSNASGGATIIGPTLVPVTIIDNDIGVGLSAPIYTVPDTNGSVSITVIRQNGTGTINVSYATTNITALAGTNYISTSGVLTFGPTETIKSFPVPILRDPRVTGDLSFGVQLSSPTPPAQLIPPAGATVVILDADPGLSFTNDNFSVLKSGTNVLITVLRSNANTGVVTVNYATANGTAVAGVDYTATSGLLTFSNGIASQAFTVPIRNNGQVQGDRQFTVNLLNPTGGAQLVPPSTATVTITDDISGLSFSSGAYTANENGGSATITVLRSNYTNSTVSVAFSTADGSGIANANYIPTNGIITFTNGETVKTFSVRIIDDSVINGDKTVQLLLGSVTGNGVLLNPNTAVLTLLETDGSLILPAGSALLSESGPVNKVIDPGETVTLLFALRNSSGTNTVDLKATLLATNGVTNPSAQADYGVLVVHGPAVSRQFSFTASGTNGQVISARLMLTDNNVNVGQATFTFTLGQSSTTYSNTAPIVINDNTSATPYPSVINISGAVGVVSKATLCLTNLNHSGPSDIDVLLVSPTSAKSLIMAKCGDGITVHNVTLTFDDSSANRLPQSSMLVSGTNQPTSYAVAPPPFPVPAPPPPYNTNLAAFNGAPPNGAWSLYIFDDTSSDSGIISNGWRLTLTTVDLQYPAADAGIYMTAVQPSVIATSNEVFNVVVTNYGPSTATNIVITDTLPAGATFVSASPSLGSATTNGSGQVTWTISSLAKDSFASMSLTVRPNVAGLVTNSATVATGTSDLNPDNNTASVGITVFPPSADLALGLIGSPNPVFAGANLTYTLIVTNIGGPATAPAVTITNTLPPSVTFLSASPAGYTVVDRVVTFTNLGSVDPGNQKSASIVVRATAVGEITNSAVCGSSILDPLKGNNSAAVKTVVESLQFGITRSGPSLVISWSGSAGNYGLEYATNLHSPILWTPLTTPPATLNAGQYSVQIPIGSGNQYFRLRQTGP